MLHNNQGGDEILVTSLRGRVHCRGGNIALVLRFINGVDVDDGNGCTLNNYVAIDSPPFNLFCLCSGIYQCCPHTATNPYSTWEWNQFRSRMKNMTILVDFGGEGGGDLCGWVVHPCRRCMLAGHSWLLVCGHTLFCFEPKTWKQNTVVWYCLDLPC